MIVSSRGSGKSLVRYEIPDLSASTNWLAYHELMDPDGPDEMFEPIGRRGLLRGLRRYQPTRMYSLAPRTQLGRR